MQNTSRCHDDCDPLTKECRKCKKVKSITEYYHCRTRADGHAPWCIFCTNGRTGAQVIARKQLSAEKQAERMRNWTGKTKTCYVCKQSIPWFDFMVNVRNRNYPGARCLQCKNSPDVRAAYQRLRAGFGWW